MSSAVGLTTQLLTLSIVSLQRQISHNQLANRTQFDPSYDYVVVGSGSAGAVVANRLAAVSPRIRVLLLEAGGPQTVISDMPGMTPTLVGTRMDWQYRTVPQTNLAQAFRGQVCNQPKGKVIGGTSTINWMLYNRGNRRSYDRWSSMYGATGWHYNSVLPYFRMSENNTDPEVVANNHGYHGTSGPLGVSSMPVPDPILYLFQKQMNSFGVPTRDINGENQLGTMIYQLNVKRGVRSSTGNAFIDPNPYPDNLHILTNSLVTRVLFQMDSSNVTATGVEFRDRNGQRQTVTATREVILSGGCFGTPQLLLLSGVGPRAHLSSLQIPLVADLPVGENLQDHVFIHHYYRVKNQSLLNPPVGPTTAQLYDFYGSGTGRLTELPNSITFFSTPSNDDPQFPNAVIDTNTYNVVPNLTLAVAQYGINQELWQDYWRPYLGEQYVMITSAIYRTYSRGTLRLASRDPTVAPLIDPRYLSDPRDLESLVEMTKMLFFLTQTGEFTNYAQIFPSPIPGCSFCLDRPMWKCDSYVRCIVRQVADTALHPGGTCRMGSIDRTDVVVDPQLRVKGIGQLRVIDSSVFPELANANTNAASIMVGERGVRFIIDQLANYNF